MKALKLITILLTIVYIASAKTLQYQLDEGVFTSFEHIEKREHIPISIKRSDEWITFSPNSRITLASLYHSEGRGIDLENIPEFPIFKENSGPIGAPLPGVIMSLIAGLIVISALRKPQQKNP